MSASKPPLVCGAASGASIVGGTPAAAPEGEPSGRRGDVGRRAEEVLRVRAQLVAPALGGRGRLDDLGAFGRVDDDFLPADAGREVAVPELEPGSRRRRLVDGVEAQRLQPAGSRPLDGPTLEHAQRRAAAVDAEVEVPRRLRGERRPADRVAELERRDLGHVERVVDVDPAAGELDRRVPVDGEVAERVRLRRRRDEQRRQAGDDEQQHASCQGLPGHRGPADGEVRVQVERSAEPRLRGAVVAEAALDHGAVEVEVRVTGAEPQGALRVAERLTRIGPPGRAPRPACRRRGSRAAPRGPRGPARPSRPAGGRGRRGRARSRGRR